jgi:hypothetical protein
MSTATLVRPTSTTTTLARPTVGSVLAMPFSGIYVATTVLASAVFALGMISSLGAARLQRGTAEAPDSDELLSTGMLEEEFLFFDGEI